MLKMFAIFSFFHNPGSPVRTLEMSHVTPKTLTNANKTDAKSGSISSNLNFLQNGYQLQNKTTLFASVLTTGNK